MIFIDTREDRLVRACVYLSVCTCVCVWCVCVWGGGAVLERAANFLLICAFQLFSGLLGKQSTQHGVKTSIVSFLVLFTATILISAIFPKSVLTAMAPSECSEEQICIQDNSFSISVFNQSKVFWVQEYF